MSLTAYSGGLDDDDHVPELVEGPQDSDDEEFFETNKNRIPGMYPWRGQEECEQSDLALQASRWMTLTAQQRKAALGAVKRLLITPLLFQQITCPEKWLRWTQMKGMMNFEYADKQLPSGKLSREHYLAVKMLEQGLRQLQSMVDKKPKIVAIMKTMYSIRNFDSKNVEKAICSTKTHENVKIIANAVKSCQGIYSDDDKAFVSTSDRITFAALLCMRQFAEVVHIMTIESRDIVGEVQSQYTDYHYYMDGDLKKQKDKGNDLFNEKKYEEAIEVYTVAIDRAPFFYLLYTNRCQALIRLSKFESAFSDAFRSIVLKPEWGKGYHKAMTCLKEMGYLDEAMEYGKRGIKLCEDESIIKSLKELLHTIESETIKATDATVTMPTETAAQTVKKKKGKAKRKRKIRSQKDDDQDKDSQSDSDRMEEGSPNSSENATKQDRTKDSKTSGKKSKANGKDKYSVKVIDEEIEIMNEFQKWIEKGSVEFLKKHYADACKTYKLAIDLMENHKQIKGYNENDFATLLYSRGVASQQIGFPVEIENSRQYFQRIINEFKTFSHTCMAFYADARSTYLLNEFEKAKEKANAAMRLVRKFPINGFLVWPGTTEIIPESDETVLRREIRLLINQCCVPPLPTALCLYQDCSKDYPRKQIYVSDINFEGYFEITCDWRCVMTFHLRCWAKFKHDYLEVSGDKGVLGLPCFTPDCKGVIMCIRMLDEHESENRKESLKKRKNLKHVEELKEKEESLKTSKSNGRMVKSDVNLKRYREIQEEKKRKKSNRRKSTDTDVSSLPETRIKKKKMSANIPDNRDLSQATIILKQDHSQGAFGQIGNRRTVAPASLQSYCALLPGYRSDLSMQEIDEMIESAKIGGFNFCIPDDVLEEVQHFTLSFEEVIFTEDEKLRLPFIFHYFVSFLNLHGPVDVYDEIFSQEFALLPERFVKIMEKCGGLDLFLNASPLFIKVSRYLGVHSQHSRMKELSEPLFGTCDSPTTDSAISQFARDFFDTPLGEEDIANLIGAETDEKMDHFHPLPNLKMSQTSETSSMYSIEDAVEAKSEFSSQASYDAEKTLPQRPPSPKKPDPVVPKPLVNQPVQKKQIKRVAKSTQTEGKDDSEKAQEAIERLQERLLEMQDESTRMKRTFQAHEDALQKELEEVKERERFLIKEKDGLKQMAESEVLRQTQMKKQLQLAEARVEQGKARERDLDFNLKSLTEGMQRDRDHLLHEIVELQRSVEVKEKDLSQCQKRAVFAEIDLMKTKEAYHVGAHMQAKNHCENGVREFDHELTRIAAAFPDHVVHQFKIARELWVKNVIGCVKAIETLKAAYSSIIEQLNAGRALADLPPVPDIKPPPPGPNPRQMMNEYQTTGKISLPGIPTLNGGSGDSKRVNGNESGAIGRSSGTMHKSRITSPLPALTKMPAHSTPANMAPTQPPIGSELLQAPKKKSFIQLVEKLSKNIPQLTKEQVEMCAQVVRTENNGLTGLSFEEIANRIRQMVRVETAGSQNRQSLPPTYSQVPSTSARHGWKMPRASAYGNAAREMGDAGDFDDEALCPICCDPLKDGRVSTLECHHKFHFNCINEWMKKQRTCPNCRKFMADTTEFPSLSGEAPSHMGNHH